MTKRRKIDYTYTGASEYQPPSNGVNGLRDPQGREYFPYLPDPGLVKALNLAIALQRPLLLEGQPGCGKTRVAFSLAYELACKRLGGKKTKPERETDWWNFYIWNVTSASRARDGLYTFDAVGRLRDAQYAQLVGTDPDRLQEFLGEDAIALKTRMRDKAQYLEFGPLGKALQNQPYRPVVLIDEIDKADSDFPNDLLLQLDELRFDIPEAGISVPSPDADKKPIILITSNQEKPLSEAFLRRCLYYYVPFPSDKELRRIIEARCDQKVAQKEAVVDLALKKFRQVYTVLDGQPISRPPGTSEFLEFLTALLQENQTVEAAVTQLNQLSSQAQLHLLGTLIKTKRGQKLYRDTYPSPDSNSSQDEESENA